jgi:2,5-diketo-D-gluconate reductase B
MSQDTFKGMPLLGFGTWQISDGEAERGVRDALEIGYRHIDTARAYGNERGVGRAIAGSNVPRAEIWVTTKIWSDDHEPSRLASAAEDSLRQLDTDYVDLLLLHWPSPDIPVEDTLEALQAVQQRGLTRQIGVSNFPPGLFRRALRAAPGIFNNQVEFHPFLAQDELLAIAEEHDNSITAYSPLAVGKAVKDPTIGEIAEKHGKSPAQVALRYLLEKPRTAVIPKASSHERRLENFQIQDFELTPEDTARLDALPKDERESDPSWGPDWNS